MEKQSAVMPAWETSLGFFGVVQESLKSWQTKLQLDMFAIPQQVHPS
jgi:hypothetical protein